MSSEKETIEISISDDFKQIIEKFSNSSIVAKYLLSGKINKDILVDNYVVKLLLPEQEFWENYLHISLHLVPKLPKCWKIACSCYAFLKNQIKTIHRPIRKNQGQVRFLA